MHNDAHGLQHRPPCSWMRVSIRDPLLPMKEAIRKYIAKAGPFLGLIVVIVLFAIPTESREFFLTYHNFKIIFTQTVIVALSALGMTLIIASGGIDLSGGSSIAFSSVVGAMLIQRGYGPAATAIAMIVSGGGVGLLNGAALAGRRMRPFIITLGTLGVVRATAKGPAPTPTLTFSTPPLSPRLHHHDSFLLSL